jgi:thymidylate synthase
MKVDLIVAFDSNFLIGDSKTYDLPWNIKEDKMFFRKITMERNEGGECNYLICGYNTWYHNLKDLKIKSRKFIVINRDIETIEQMDSKTYFINNIELLNDLILELKDLNKLIVIGGRGVYSYFLQNPKLLNNIYITQIKKKYKGDIYFPFENIKYFKLISCKRVITKDNIKLDFCKYIIDKKYNEENQYLLLVDKIIKKGIESDDRTGTGIISYFGSQCEYDLSNDTIPILTTKKVFLKGIIEELLWFLKGQTDNKILKDKGVKIWNGNSTRQFLNSRGLQRLNPDDCGAIYGFQARRFGTEYKDCKTNYEGKGFDQISYVINEIKNNPNSRRIVLSMWNPQDLKNMSLPPCHILYNFRVYGNKLCLSMYQRSGDIMLGVPFNITSSCLLLHIIAKLTGKIAWKFIHSIGDNHIYNNHINAAYKQLKRNPLGFPKLIINNNKQFNRVEDFEYSDFNIIGYMYHKPLKMKMAV